MKLVCYIKTKISCVRSHVSQSPVSMVTCGWQGPASDLFQQLGNNSSGNILLTVFIFMEKTESIKAQGLI